jgi:short-subunit dehydrogenase
MLRRARCSTVARWVLIGFSSVVGRTPRSGNAGYAATKWGMNDWSEALRQELQPDVRVIVVEPGAVATELPEHIAHGQTKEMRQRRRPPSPRYRIEAEAEALTARPGLLRWTTRTRFAVTSPRCRFGWLEHA